MLPFDRPRKPKDFDLTMKPWRECVQAGAVSEAGPLFESKRWQNYKDDYFFPAQHRKCGYCERKVTGHTGAVDHYRPKGMVKELGPDPAAWGRELPNSTKFVDRSPDRVSVLGYWWLAYSWENWLLACERCNSWKGNLFPIVEARTEIKTKFDHNQETELLLNPFELKNASDHFFFESNGVIEGISDDGIETVRTVGLDRESLRDARESTALRIYTLAIRFKRLCELKEELAQVDDEWWVEIIRDIVQYGQTREEFAGMARIVFEQVSDMTWDELEAEYSKVGPADPIDQLSSS